jgi:hypothetical protein
MPVLFGRTAAEGVKTGPAADFKGPAAKRGDAMRIF